MLNVVPKGVWQHIARLSSKDSGNRGKTIASWKALGLRSERLYAETLSQKRRGREVVREEGRGGRGEEEEEGRKSEAYLMQEYPLHSFQLCPLAFASEVLL